MSISLFPGQNKVYSSYTNAVSGTLVVSSFDSESIASLYMVNAVGAVAPHWLGIINGGSFVSPTPAVGTTPLLFAFRNPGTNGFQLAIDETFFRSLDTRGFTLVRSNNPGLWTQVPSILANPVDIQVIARPTALF